MNETHEPTEPTEPDYLGQRIKAANDAEVAKLNPLALPPPGHRNPLALPPPGHRNPLALPVAARDPPPCPKNGNDESG